MIIYALIAFTFFAVFVLLFTSRTLSPIPYFPSNPKDLPLTLQALKLRNNQALFDLGAGDGLIIFHAAKEAYKLKFDTEFYAVEINPVLIFILHIRRLLHPNRKNIYILWGDMFKLNYRNYIHDPKTDVIFYLYISPWLLEKTTRIIREMNRQVRIVSYFYPIHSLKEFEQKVEGVHKVFRYELHP